MSRTDRRLDIINEKQDGQAGRSLRSPRAALSRWANTGILFSVLLIGFLSYLTLRSTRKGEDDSDWVFHTQTVQKTLQSAVGNAIDTVSGGRGFRLTGQDTFLNVEAQAERRLNLDLDALRRLTADNANQQKRLGRLKMQVNASLESTLKSEAATQRTGGVPFDSEFLESTRDMDSVRATVAEMQDEEARLLVLRMVKAREARHLIRIIVWSSALMGMGLLAFFGFLLRRETGSGARMDVQLRRLNGDLRKSKDVLERTGRITGIGGWEVEIVTRAVSWSRETYNILGVELDYLPTLINSFEFYPPEVRPVIVAAVEEAMGGGNGWDLDLPVIRADDRRIWVRCVGEVESEGGEPFRVVGAFQDITERVTERTALKSANYMAHLANHDALTGLPTRTLFRDRLDAALTRAIRYKRRVGVLVVDLDNFKKVNDLMGHHVGDELLTVIAKRLQSCVRASDTVARMGGDEFTIVLDELRCVEDAELVAEKIVQAIKMPVSIGSEIIAPTASIGISVYPETGQTVEALLTNADGAMYKAKAEGGNASESYTRQLELAASRKRQLEDCLSHALELNEFELVYQPQICMKTGRVSGVEALLRWHSGKLGLVMPGEFISLAEENGMIVPIGEWALRTACRQGARLQLEIDRPLTIAVNISPRQFQQNSLPHIVNKILADSGLSPSSLELEITENVLIGDLPRPKAILEEIRSLGVHVAIDDFGTGFSSMSYILRFRVDRLKIDQSFIREMAVDPDSHAVTNAVIALAKGLHIPVVAEGVESAIHRDLLLGAGCDEAQGYFYSRPLPMQEIRDAIHAIEHPDVSMANV